MKIRLHACVAALLIACFPLAHAADLLVTNINGYTLDGAGKLTRFRALLVDHGKVVATGSQVAMKKHAGSAQIKDGHGSTLLPGLIDAHGHVMGLGYMKSQADLTETTSLDEANGVMKAFADAHKDAVWVRGRGWNQVVWRLGR
ncbi:MAG: amidohydrolase family protein, partial [Dokdonella sp.]